MESCSASLLDFIWRPALLVLYVWTMVETIKWLASLPPAPRSSDDEEE
jgi:hypothetical protein